MCGIVGYLGNREAYPILIKGLRRLEYRGYDSAGVAVLKNDAITLVKTKGKVAELEKKAGNTTLESKIGIGHTRWATHGIPSDVNSHPHISNNGEIVLIHNGIIENYEPIKQMLMSNGYTFQSETDTEVLVNLIQYFKEKENLTLAKATRFALNEVYGAYAIAVMEKNNPNEIITGKLGSPLAIGIGDGEFFIASDASPFIEYTKNAVYLEDGEIGVIRRGKELEIRKIKNDHIVEPAIQELKLNLEQIEKGGYEHFMLKEIYEQPKSIHDTLRGRLLNEDGIIKMAGIWDHRQKWVNAKRIIIIACGTSWHAGLIGEYLFESIARIPVEVEYASEFRYRNPIIYADDIVIAISQSGETADTLAALKMAKEKGAFIFGICNVVGSSIARLTDAGAYTHAGPEIGVASTKAFTAQVSILSLLALKLGNHKGTVDNQYYKDLCEELERIPEKVKEALKIDTKIVALAQKYVGFSNALFLGRGYNFPSALEGALKLKEISYIHAEGYPAAEMKHGPIALIDENMPVIIIATKNEHYEKVVSNIQEIKSRKGQVIAIVTNGDSQIAQIADHVIEVPETLEAFSPIVNAIPMQLFSYHVAVLRGANVDQPRNLAKSVTVE
ncbi:MAG: glutamine--fructose-6-phosphate transaminase (isomerizing) [Flavobacteriales bacterium]